jgi:hypothetical protein
MRWEQHTAVAYEDPLADVVAGLTAPPDFNPEPDPVVGVEDRAPRAMFMSYGPFARDPADIEVHKQRESDGRRLYALSFDDLQGNRWFWLVAAERDATGWTAHSVAGGSDGPCSKQRRAPRPSSAGSGSWLNVCGQWGGDTFYAGGRLDAGGAEIGRVELTLNDGGQLKDDGVGGVSPFIGRHGERQTCVEIYAPDGALISRRNAF